MRRPSPTSSNIGRDYAGHEQVTALHLNAALSYLAEADPIHSLVDGSGGARRTQQTVAAAALNTNYSDLPPSPPAQGTTPFWDCDHA